MFRRRRQFGRRYKRYRTPFTGSSYLYAAEMEFRGRATTISCGPVAVGEMIATPVRWTLGGSTVSEANGVVPMTYPMISKMLCNQGAPRTMSIAGWATGFVGEVEIDFHAYLRQWCTEYVTRVYPSALNILERRGLTDIYALQRIAYGQAEGVSILAAMADIADRLTGRITDLDEDTLRSVVADIWTCCRMTTITDNTSKAYVHIPFTYMARSKPPRAVQRLGVWVFAKSQLMHQMSEKALEKGVKKYGVRAGASVLNEQYMQTQESDLLDMRTVVVPGLGAQ